MSKPFTNRFINLSPEQGSNTLQTLVSSERRQYSLERLAQHLYEAGFHKKLATLFNDDSWMKLRFEGSHYRYDGYLEDLSLAWTWAHTEAGRQIETNQEARAFADCLRYLLIYTSVNSTAGNYTPEIVARAVEVGLWAPDRALSIAAKIPDGIERVEMYIALLETAKLRNEHREEAQRQGLEVALALESESEQVEMLAALAPHLEEKLRSKALERALKTAFAPKYDSDQVNMLIALAPYLTGEMLERALKLAFSWSEFWQDQARLLEALAPQLMGGLRNKALERALEATLPLDSDHEEDREAPWRSRCRPMARTSNMSAKSNSMAMPSSKRTGLRA